MNTTKHPTQTAAYWRDMARSERTFAKHERTGRGGTVESIRIHEANAAEYEATADRIEAEEKPLDARGRMAQIGSSV
jgi:hypothetical protein